MASGSKPRRLAATGLWLGLAACGGSRSAPDATPAATPAPGQPSLTARLVVAGLAHPLDLQAAPGDRERLYVAEQGGRIVVLRNGRPQGATWARTAWRRSTWAWRPAVAARTMAGT